MIDNLVINKVELLIFWNMQIPVRKVMPWQMGVSRKFTGSNAGAIFFLEKYLLKCTCTII